MQEILENIKTLLQRRYELGFDAYVEIYLVEGSVQIDIKEDRHIGDTVYGNNADEVDIVDPAGPFLLVETRAPTTIEALVLLEQPLRNLLDGRRADGTPAKGWIIRGDR